MDDAQQHVLDAFGMWGDALCAWCCAVSTEELQRFRATFAEIPASAGEAATAVALLGRKLLEDSDEPHPLHARSIAASRLAMIVKDREHTVLNAIRREAGGEVPDRFHEDPLVAASRWLGRDVLPCYLLLEAHDGGPEHDQDLLEMGREFLFEYAGYKHPAILAFKDAFADDERFASLREALAAERTLTGTDLKLSGSTYLVGDALPHAPLVHGADLVRGLIEAAWDRQLLAGVADPSLALARIPEVLDELVRALAGEQIEVPACVGLRGLALPQGAEPRVRGGVLRAPTLGEWRRSGDDDQVALVLQLRMKSSINATADVGHARWRGWHAPPWPDLADRAEAVSLASALASDSDFPPGVTVAWASVCGPMGQERVELRPGGRPEDVVVLDDDGAKALVVWTARVHRHGARLPSVARRRAISALHERAIYADGLVDAIISLESLFGGGASLRLQAACAWLLAPQDLEARRRIFDSAGALYGLRSATVHNGSAVVGDDWQQAVGLLRSVLRRLLTDRTDLLTGAGIGDRLVLGEPPPPRDERL